MAVSETSTAETLERFYGAEAAFVAAGGPGRASFDDVAACLDPEVTLHQAPGLPYSDTYRGQDGIERFMAVMGEAWQSMEFLSQRCFIQGESVVVTNHVRLVARATGRAIDTRIIQEMTMRGGRIYEIRPYYWEPAAVSAVLTAN